jgi:hypothetical protein
VHVRSQNHAKKNEKKQIIQNIVDFLEPRKYNPLELSRYTYLVSLDEKIYLSDDTKLNELMYTLSGMDAGAEFVFNKKEVLEMLSTYLLSVE